MMESITKAANGIVDALFPMRPPCALCSKPVGVDTSLSVCSCCVERLGVIGQGQCDRCGRPGKIHTFDTVVPMDKFKIRRKFRRLSSTCRWCQSRPPIVDLARSYGVYEGYLRECIHDLKYRGDLTIARGLGELMALLVWRTPAFGRIDMVVPVPLHPTRLKERGYNQASLLAKTIGSELGLSVVEAVQRTRETPAQSKLSWQERAKNVERAFSVALPSQVREKRVLIVDDVYTTGATISAMAGALKRAGAVRCLAVCAAAAASDRDYV